TGKRIKRTYYLDDGKTIKNIDEYDKNTGKKVKETQYDEYEKILYIEEYEKETGKRIKETHYLDDGKTIEKIIECDKNTGNVIKVIKETHL
ncbi:DUF2963 domain-containing protein, partial [Chrysanthemum yellows phytoplasma]|uniref:DUF2963 domain-containing protein n=1 Tax=Chrysanthemum yellows phytoplasma TaxID=238674 RepID=UPI00054CC047